MSSLCIFLVLNVVCWAFFLSMHLHQYYMFSFWQFFHSYEYKRPILLSDSFRLCCCAIETFAFVPDIFLFRLLLFKLQFLFVVSCFFSRFVSFGIFSAANVVLL